MSTGGATAGAVAAVVAAKRKHIYNLFRIAGATTISNAKTLQDIHVSESLKFDMLVRRGEVVKIDGDRYYIDEAAVQAGRRKRLMIIAAVLLVGAIVCLIAYYSAG